ncbi:MAG: DUF1501 domain-containing protein [Aquisalinus sp.]|nr:DUF1501 domain-containing protein [Aquisalinus sp.]
MSHFIMNRRAVLLGLSSSLAAVSFGGPAVAQTGIAGKKFVFVILRGGMDGLGAMIPTTDQFYEGLRKQYALETGQLLPLDANFGLNPFMPNFHALAQNGEALLMHAVGAPMNTRSHFDDQEGLERGVSDLGDALDGWLNRALVAMGAEAEGIAVGITLPQVLRGDASIVQFSPANFPEVDSDTLNRIVRMTTNDTLIGPPSAEIVQDTLDGRFDLDVGADASDFEKAAAILVDQDPQLASIVVIQVDGWDTHTGADPLGNFGVGGLLGSLDDGLQLLKDGLGAEWSNTAVVALSEFGRRAELNSSLGFDHGTGGLALMTGGAINASGGPVIGDFPGLAPNQLHEGRDLAVATDCRAIFKGIMRDHLALDLNVLNTDIFPDSADIAPLSGLIG